MSPVEIQTASRSNPDRMVLRKRVHTLRVFACINNKHISNHQLFQSSAVHNIQAVSPLCILTNVCSKSHNPLLSCDRILYIGRLASIQPPNEFWRNEKLGK